ncbi:YycH family regulatory protein [Bacillus sp. T33-2]|uniref:YycH family regulatory protein n=1 Tax=Bacillus sp. T33-2 TaxID=2054168 RepID=UPI000C7583EE|nr:two-component system activity regulator YycH [Bacillus sp. T33-2]PLR96486.1 hypothetical protein CVD19_10845 [Bacillus sp. T33-2]
MTYENIKTALLTVLVALSGALTWGIWTFQPNLETMENADTVNEVALSSKQELKKVVKPHQVIYHYQGNDYGTMNNNDLDRVINELDKWKFYDVRNYSDRMAEFNEKVGREGMAEIIFPDDIPVELYQKVLNFDDKELPRFEFDRILINVHTSGKQEGEVYFLSSKAKQAYICHVNPAFINEFNNEIYHNADELPQYFQHQLKNGRVVYLPEEKIEMAQYKYRTVQLDSEQLKNALFKDPRFVQKSYSSGIEEYTDDTSKMTVNTNINMIEYINPLSDKESVSATSNAVQKSIDFVNGHSGWTGLYRFADRDDSDRAVTFRLYSKDGYPVFNPIGMSEIKQVWGQTEINKYTRPGFQLQLQLDTAEETIMSGREILEMLGQQKDIKPEYLDDLTPGYYMRQDSDNPSLIILEPGWFYSYNNQWNELTTDGTGGAKSGLE